MMKILKDIGPQFLRGTGMTLLIFYDWTIAGLIIGLVSSDSQISAGCQPPLGGSSMSTLKPSPWTDDRSIHGRRGSAQAFLNISLIVPGPPSLSYPSIPGVYMSGRLFVVDEAVGSSQFEAATALEWPAGQNHAQGRPSTGCSQYLASK